MQNQEEFLHGTDLVKFHIEMENKMRMKDEIQQLKRELRDKDEIIKNTKNKLYDLLDAVQEIIQFGFSPRAISYLDDVYQRITEQEGK